MAGRHLIQRQMLDIALDRQEYSFQMQNRLSQLCRDKMNDLLDVLCSAASDGGKAYRIGRLEVDLGEISDVNLENDFLEKFQERFPAVLRGHIVNIEQASLSLVTRNRCQPKASLTEMDSVDDSQSHEMAQLEAFLYFIKTGMMPWWYSESSVHPDHTFSELLAKHEKQLVEYLQPLLRHPTARERFIRQLPSPLLSQYLAMVLGGSKKDLFLSVVEDMTRLGEAQRLLAAKMWHYMVWDVLIRTSFADENEIDMRHLTELLTLGYAQHRAKKYGQGIKEMHALIRQSKQSGTVFKSNFPAWIEALMKASLNSIEHEWTRALQSSPAWKQQQGVSGEQLVNVDAFGCVINSDDGLLSTPESCGDSEGGLALSDASRRSDGVIELTRSQHDTAILTELYLKDQRQQTSAVDREDADLARHGMYTAFAGQVILWPYLKHYFSELQLIKKDCFVGECEQMRSVHLLQYLVADQQQTPECQLMLNKILCGWPLDRPLDDGILLSQQEKMESKQLLSTMISHWSALKNTSIEGLRESFLKRSGKLTRTELGWTLRVERKAHDMLLEQLPWTLSIIQLSWMKQALFVEW